MTATTAPVPVRNDVSHTRPLRIGTVVAAIFLVSLAVINLFWPLAGGTFTRASDYAGTANALPLGIGLVLTVTSFHRLQRGADGRLGTVGVLMFTLCSLEIVVQCMASLAVGSELTWGPAYPLCTLGSSLGLALLAAGSWRVGLLPKWLLGIWPPLGVVGSWLGIGPIPVLYAAFLLTLGEIAARRLRVSAALRTGG